MASHLSTQLLLLVASLVALVLGRKWQARYTNLKYLPKVPGGHWFWGHEKVAWIMPNSLFYTNNFERFGTGIFVMKGAVGQPDILAISDPAAISQIFTKNAYNYVKSPYIRPFLERLVGRGIVWSEGEDHKSQSVALAPVFTHTKLRGHHAEMCASAEKFVGAINDHIDRQESLAAHDGEGAVQVDAIEWANKVTMDIIGRVGLGYDFQLGDAPEAKRILGAFFEAVAAGHTLPGFVAPLVIRAFPFIASLPIKSIQADGVAKLVTRELSTRLIRDRKLLEADGQMVRNDYLSALLRLHGDSNEQSVWDAISDQILAMILANQDDAADILAMAVYTLSRDKDAQERLRNELLSFSASSQGAEPTYDDYLNRLPFLDACIKEILRLYPSVDHTERVALQDDILPLSVPVKDPKSGKEINSVRIRAGQVIRKRRSEVFGVDHRTDSLENFLKNLADDIRLT
ncbi:hypothetical protein FRB97_008136 [Tulasnella sp. 331]|nr:hypothetical protein FRB97_008136 [Tulasnella sp. 331]